MNGNLYIWVTFQKMQNTKSFKLKESKLVWFREGVKLLSEGGLSNFNIDVLSRATGKAKTSFYHYFKSKEMFFVYLAEYWEYAYSDAYFSELTKISDPIMKLDKMIDLAYANMKDEMIWIYFKDKSVSNSELKTIVDRVEKGRIDNVTKILLAMKYPRDLALDKAKAFMYLFFGWSMLHEYDDQQSMEIEEFKNLVFNTLLKKG